MVFSGDIVSVIPNGITIVGDPCLIGGLVLWIDLHVVFGGTDVLAIRSDVLSIATDVLTIVTDLFPIVPNSVLSGLSRVCWRINASRWI